MNWYGEPMNRWTAEEGSVYPLGATFVEEEQAYNFALYSKYATGGDTASVRP